MIDRLPLVDSLNSTGVTYNQRDASPTHKVDELTGRVLGDKWDARRKGVD
ncbi:MAG: hypothetical protein WBV31_02825 [Terriglobales bacterium]|jgi:hypothetical protein